MPCPWYRGGLCTSPRLKTPSSAVVSPDRCLSDTEYLSCEYYVDPAKAGRSPQGLEQHIKPAIAQQLKPYPPIHVVQRRPRSGCPNMKVYEYSGGYLAFCTVLNRLLTRSEVETCEKHWRTCPLRKYA